MAYISSVTAGAINAIRLTATNARIMRMLTSMATLDLRTEESIATPSSVKANVPYLLPPLFEVAICDLNLSSNKLHSSFVSSNIKSSGNLSIFLRTDSLSLFVSTPYILARSLSSITCTPLIS